MRRPARGDSSCTAARLWPEYSHLSRVFPDKVAHSGDMARKLAWQFMNTMDGHRVSMLRKTASAVGTQVVDLFKDGSP
jgi:hypothetical protein